MFRTATVRPKRWGPSILYNTPLKATNGDTYQIHPNVDQLITIDEHWTFVQVSLLHIMQRLNINTVLKPHGIKEILLGS